MLVGLPTSTIRSATLPLTLDYSATGRSRLDSRMLDIAEKIIDQQRGDFEPTLFVDRYEHALREVIQRKRQGMPVVVGTEEVPETNIVNLMDALKRSLGDAGGPSVQKRPPAANRNKPTKPRARPRKRVA